MTTFDDRSPWVQGPLAALLKPGLRVMRGMRLPAKMGLLGAMLAMPLFLLMTLAMIQASGDMAVARSEREGTLLARQVTELVVLVQSHRSLSNQVAAGVTALTPARDAVRVQLRQAVQQADQAIAATKTFTFDDLWPAERERLLARS